MVVSLQGPLTLKNRYHVDSSAFTVEFDADISVSFSKAPMKSKLRLDNYRRYRFKPGETYYVVATVNFMRLRPDFSGQVRETGFTQPGEGYTLFGDIITLVVVPTPHMPAHEMQQRPLLMLSGLVCISDEPNKTFFVSARQHIANFSWWGHAANRLEIPIRGAFDTRRYRGDLQVPSVGSHVVFQGYFDDYSINSRTGELTFLAVIVESLEIRCATRRLPPPIDDVLDREEDDTGMDRHDDEASPRPEPASEAPIILSSDSESSVAPTPTRKPSKRTRTE